MTKIAEINCEGLSTALTALRIKQTLIVGSGQKLMSLRVSVSKVCDRKLLMQSLGQQADIVHLV